MSLNALGLGFMFTATDLASGVMKNVKSNFTGLEDAANKSITNLDKMTRKLGAGLTAAAIGLGGLGVSFNMAKQAGDLEFALARVKITTRATETQMKFAKLEALRLSQAFGTAPENVAMGMKFLAQQGYSFDKVMKYLPNTMKFATAGQIDLEKAIDLTAQSMRAFGIPAELMINALDQMVGVADMSSADIKDLPIGIGRALSGARAFGASLTDTLGMFALIKNVLGSVQVSGTAVSLIFSRMMDPKYRALLEKGLNIKVTNGRGGFRDTVDVMEDMIQALGKLSDVDQAALLKSVFGGDAMKGIQGLLAQVNAGIENSSGEVRKGLGAFRWMVENQIAGMNGNLDRAADTLLGTYNSKVDQLKTAFNNAMVRLGDPFMKIWMPVIDATKLKIEEMGKAFSGIDPRIQTAIAVVFTAGAALLALAGIIGVVVAAWPLFAAGFSILGGVLGGLVGLSWPIIAVLLGVGLAVYAISDAIDKNLGGMGDTWNRFVGAFVGEEGMLTGFLDFLSDAWDMISDGFTYTMNEIPWDYISDALNDMMDEFGELKSYLGWFLPGGGGSFIKMFFMGVGRIIAWLATLFLQIFTILVKVATVVAWVFNNIVLPILVAVIATIGLMIGAIVEIGQALGILPQSLGDPMKKVMDWAKTGMDSKKRLASQEAEGDGPRQSETRGSVDKRTFTPRSVKYADYESMESTDPLLGKPAAAAQQEISRNPFAGIQPGSERESSVINYEKFSNSLAEAFAKHPINLSVDGENLFLINEKWRARDVGRRNGR